MSTGATPSPATASAASSPRPLSSRNSRNSSTASRSVPLGPPNAPSNGPSPGSPSGANKRGRNCKTGRGCLGNCWWRVRWKGGRSRLEGPTLPMCVFIPIRASEGELAQAEPHVRHTTQVRHPFKGASSELVSQRLAEQVGIVTLPGTFFSPPFADTEQDRYIRFSIANVDEATLRKVPARLAKLSRMWPSL